MDKVETKQTSQPSHFEINKDPKTNKDLWVWSELPIVTPLPIENLQSKLSSEIPGFKPKKDNLHTTLVYFGSPDDLYDLCKAEEPMLNRNRFNQEFDRVLQAASSVDGDIDLKVEGLTTFTYTDQEKGHKTFVVAKLEDDPKLIETREKIMSTWQDSLKNLGIDDPNHFLSQKPEWKQQLTGEYIPHITLGEIPSTSQIPAELEHPVVTISVGEPRLGNVTENLDSLPAELKDIYEKRSFAQKIVEEFQEVIQKRYGANIEGTDSGSYNKGTYNPDDPTLDIDPTFANIPTKSNTLPLIDWSNKDTYQMTGSYDGITNFKDVIEIANDPYLSQTIKDCMDKLGTLGENPRFNWLRSWSDFPGLIFNIGYDDPKYGHLDFDVALYHSEQYFGVDHANRFVKYFDKYRREYGDDKALQFIKDIRKLKGLFKKESMVDGKLDKQRKVPGFIAESIFTRKYPPGDFDTTVEEINNFELKNPDNLPDRLQNVTTPLVRPNKMPLGQILKHLSKGGYQTVKSVAKQVSKPNATNSNQESTHRFPNQFYNLFLYSWRQLL